MTQDTRDRVGGPRNVLYLTDQHDECDEAGCIDLLGADAPDDVDVLFVSFTETARERLATWRRHADAPPANVGVVSVETAGSSTEGAFGDGGPTVRRVSDPSDLTGVGIAISEFLSAWADDGNRTVVCFDSLTALLQYLEPRRVFQFCNEITSKFETAGATTHFHITPEAHDRQVLSVLASLFDDRVSAADLGYRRGDRGRTDDGAPAGTAGSAGTAETVDESIGADSAPPDTASADGPASPDEASTAGEASPDESSTADAPGEGGFVFAGDEFSREATRDPSGAEASEDEFTRGGSGDAGAASDGESARGEEHDGPTDDEPDVETGDPAGTRESGSSTDPAGTDEPPESPERPETTAPATNPEPSRGPGRSGFGPRGSDDPEPSGSDATIPRTTATVVGVVVMLVLMSFLAAAFPTPLVLDDSNDGDEVGADTVTPEDAATGADVEETDGTTATPTVMDSGTESTETATETPASDATSTPTETTSDSSFSDAPTGTDGMTPTATTEPVSTETATSTPTPTPTPEDGGLLDDPLDTL